MEGGLQGAPSKISIFLEGIYFGGPWTNPKSEKFGKKIIGPLLLHKKEHFFVLGWLFFQEISFWGFFRTWLLSHWCGHTAPANNWISEMALQWLPCPLCDFPLFHTNEKTASPQFTRLKRSFLANLFIIFPTKKLCIWFHSLSYKIN